MVNWNIILTVIIITIILIILILLTLNYFNKIENFNTISAKYGYICNYNSDCTQEDKTLCITEGYSVYACGYAFGLNKFNVPTEIGLSEIVPITNFSGITIKDINGGFDYIRILTNDGNVLFSGNYILNTSLRFTQLSFTQLPIGNIKKIFNNGPNAIKNGKATSANGVFFCLTYDNKLYCCGMNGDGQLGLGDMDDRSELTLIPPSSYGNKIIKDVGIGPGFTMFLTEDDEIYGCGLNTSGQLGTGNQVSPQTVPVKVPSTSYNSTKIKSIYCGESYTFIISETGDVFSAGAGLGSAIGYTLHQSGAYYAKISASFTPVLVGENISSIYTVGSTSYFLRDNGASYSGPRDIPALGWDVWHVYNLYSINKKVKSITSSAYYYYIIYEDGVFATNYTTRIGGSNIYYSIEGKNAVIDSGNKVITADGRIWENSSELVTCNPRCYYRTITNEIGNIGENVTRGYNFGSYSIAVTENGNLYGIGDNTYGQLGLGDTSSVTTFTQITSAINIFNNVSISSDIIFKKISSKSNSSLFLTEEGTVYGCGLNNSGQLGTGDTLDKNGLQMIGNTTTNAETLSNIKQVSASLNHTLILTEDGNVYASGLNDYGQLGLHGFKETAGENYFIQVPLSNVNKISCGEDNSYFLMDNGEVYSCGRNNYGQLGLDHTTDVDRPTKIPNLSNIIDISAKYDSCLFLKDDSVPWACGRNNHGQLGLGNQDDQPLPTENTTLSYIVKIFMGYECSFYIDEFGDYHACGRNYYGQLGLGDTDDRDQADKNLSEDSIIDISCGKHFNMFLKSEGYVYSCGRHGEGRLGIAGLTADKQDLSIINFRSTVITAIYSGDNHTLFKDNANNVYVCGTGNNGQLGVGSTTVEPTPTQIGTINDVDIINCGTDNSFILKNTGELYSFGRNDQGQLGLRDGIEDKNEPAKIDYFSLIEYINGIKDIEVGVNESFFLKEDGSVYVTTDKLPRPMLYLTDQNIKQISIADDGFMTDNGSKLFLTEEGNVYCFGLNNYGQLGLGHQNNIEEPTKIEFDNLEKDFVNIKKIICKGTFSMFLMNEGTVYVTGSGPIGLGYTVTKPTIIPFMSNIKDISASIGHSLFLTEDGFVYGCGTNDAGQLASAQLDIIIPIKLNMMNIKAISCGTKHSLFVTKFNEVYSCGENGQGQLGLGDNTIRRAPAICSISDVKNVYSGDAISYFFKVEDV